MERTSQTLSNETMNMDEIHKEERDTPNSKSQEKIIPENNFTTHLYLSSNIVEQKQSNLNKSDKS
jgi:hypothetical protein